MMTDIPNAPTISMERGIKACWMVLSMKSKLKVMMALGMSVIMTLFSFAYSNFWYIKWWCLFLTICIALYIATPRQLRSHSVFGKLLSLPKLVWKMVMNILKIDRKNTDFIHTTHNK